MPDRNPTTIKSDNKSSCISLKSELVVGTKTPFQAHRSVLSPLLFNRKEIRELKDDVIGRERRLFENSVKMEKIAQENAVLSKDLESLIREVAAMTAKKLYIFRRLQPLILHRYCQ